MPMVKAVPRGLTATADAYLTPAIAAYLTTFRAGFDAGLAAPPAAGGGGGDSAGRPGLLFMQSDG
jgi:5-oxoprolinase (ATP-hydrolysing)